MLEVLVLSLITGGFGAGLFGIAAYITTRPGNREIRQANKAPAQISAPISQEMRDEIEQNERWWLRSYHALMLRAGAEVIGRVHGMEITERSWNGNVNISYQQPDMVALEGCICSECKSVLAAQTLPVPTELCCFEWESMNMPRMCQNYAGHGGRHQDGSSWVTVGVEHLARQPTRVRAVGGYIPRPETDWDLEVKFWMDLDRKSNRKRWA